MYNRRIQFALQNFIVDGYFLPMDNTYHLKEERDSGKSNLNVTIKNPNLCIYDFDNKKKCNFLRTEGKLGMQKSVDHILFENDSDIWRIHLIEMKSTVGYKTWLESIKPKVRTSYLTALAIADFLGIQIQDVAAYTTYETEQFSTFRNLEDPKAKVPPLGMVARNALKDEWNKDCMYLNLGEEKKIKHKKIQMIRNVSTNVLEGILNI